MISQTVKSIVGCLGLPVSLQILYPSGVLPSTPGKNLLSAAQRIEDPIL
jgi:hypothetical protein